MSGAIFVPRQIVESLNAQPNHLIALVKIASSAAWKDTSFAWGGRPHTIAPGEYVSSQRQLGDVFNMSKTSIKRVLDDLVRLGLIQIERLTTAAASPTRITILYLKEFYRKGMSAFSDDGAQVDRQPSPPAPAPREVDSRQIDLEDAIAEAKAAEAQAAESPAAIETDLFGEPVNTAPPAPKPEPQPAPPKQPRKKPSRTAPAAWVENAAALLDVPACAERAKAAGMENPAAEAEQFMNYHVSKGSKFADWERAWSTWCGNHTKFKAPQGGRPGYGQRPKTGSAWVDEFHRKASADPNLYTGGQAVVNGEIRF